MSAGLLLCNNGAYQKTARCSPVGAEAIDSMNDFDVIVVGAGLAGIGAAYRIKTECPDRTFAVLEARDTIGGTWDLFRYPGVRSDSDMFTLGYPFHPWKAAKAIADGPSILEYIRETAATFQLESHIRFQRRLVAARWSSAEGRWTLELQNGESMRCRFLYLCSGYYDYGAAHTPAFAGIESFRGRIIHPQWWPEGFDYAGKRVVVIGSGATAVTLVPTMAASAAKVTMLQRSPSYIAALPARDPVADLLRRMLPAHIAHRLVRAKNVVLSLAFYLFCRWYPKLAKKWLLNGVRRMLPKAYPVETHFEPRYAPWDQRLCLSPDEDLFKALSSGRAEMVTDSIAAFDETGIQLASGRHLEADVVVTATGLKILPLGGATLEVDGAPVKLSEALIYKGLMISGVPNVAWCVGYTNASWTLRADLSSRYVCRLLNHLGQNRFDIALPSAENLPTGRRPLLDFSAGYVLRAVNELPLQGTEAPWFLRQNYLLDFFDTLFSPLDDGTMSFSAVKPVQFDGAAPRH